MMDPVSHSVKMLFLSQYALWSCD